MRAIVCLVLLSAACATTDVRPLTDPASIYAASEDERKLVRISDEQDAELLERGFVFKDPELQAYVDATFRRVLPPGAGDKLKLRARVLRFPTINAFAAANGSIYLHLGLLAHVENEAQLAHVLAHEASHTLLRHQLKGYRDFTNKTVAVKIAGLGAAAAAGAGVPGAELGGLLLPFAYAAAVTGYSRELEEAADKAALDFLARAGYALDEAPQLFENLGEVEEPGAVEAFFWSTHPANQARAAYTRQLIESGEVARNPEQHVGAAEHQAAVRNAVLENLRLRIRHRHYAFALSEFDAALARYGEDAWLYYYAGEAHRRMAEDPEGAAREQAWRERESVDDERIDAFKARASAEMEAARFAYLRSLELDPTLVEAHRGLGLLAYRADDAETTRAELSLYLMNSTQPRDKRFVERILKEMHDAPPER